jgi:hypothetical protein
MITVSSLLKLIEKSPTKIANMSLNIKTDSFLENGGYEIPLGSECIFSVMQDSRRGFWINIVEDHNEIKLLQLQAGREGDDDVKTYCFDKEYFSDMYETKEAGGFSEYCIIATLDTKIDKEFYGYDIIETISGT